MSRIYIDGLDGHGWSIDKDRENLEKSINRIGMKTSSIIKADIVHNVWWNSILRYRKYYMRFKKNIIVTASNYIDLDNEGYALIKDFCKVEKFSNAWIAPSTKQKKIFEQHGIKSYYLPFTVDLNLFKPLKNKISKLEISSKYNIPYDLIKDRIVFGSFQRDSLGSDLSQPKWQKGPGLLIDIVRDLPKDKYLLLLAGPRRHYVINKCKEFDIPYHYIGDEVIVDDVSINSLDINAMPELYSLLDLYLITSLSEGGPKAVLEATATKTLVMSTDVGLASDFIDRQMIFINAGEYKKRLYDFVSNYKLMKYKYNELIEEQYSRLLGLIGNEAMDSRLMNIYENVLKSKL